jgi:hypothetical protein
LLLTDTIIGSDHSPLVLSPEEELGIRSSRFFFQKGWLERPDFHDLVTHKWWLLLGEASPGQDPIVVWHRVVAGLRHFLGGWGANLGKEERGLKDDILAQIRSLDGMADLSGLDMRVGLCATTLRDNSYTSPRRRKNAGDNVAGLIGSPRVTQT